MLAKILNSSQTEKILELREPEKFYGNRIIDRSRKGQLDHVQFRHALIARRFVDLETVEFQHFSRSLLPDLNRDFFLDCIC